MNLCTNFVKMDVDNDFDLGFNHEHIDCCDYVDYADCREYPPKRDKSGLSVMQLNIRGLLNKPGKFEKST